MFLWVLSCVLGFCLSIAPAVPSLHFLRFFEYLLLSVVLLCVVRCITELDLHFANVPSFVSSDLHLRKALEGTRLEVN